MQAVVPAEGHQQLADHRQHMGADVEDDPVRVMEGPLIRLAGREVEGEGVTLGIYAAGLQQEALHLGHVLDGRGPNPGLVRQGLPAHIQFATEQLLDGAVRHPVIQRQHPARHGGIRQQGLQAVVLDQAGHHRFLHQDQGDLACQRLLQYRQVKQRRGGDD
ncbi:hypothetical protein D3C79_770990 [compost metagenome]